MRADYELLICQSLAQVNPEPLGLSLSDLLTQPQRFEPTHNGFDDSPPASMLRRPPGPPSPTRPPPSPLHPAAPANAKEQQKKPTLAQRMRGSAAMHKADTALKGLFSSGPGKKHAGPAPSLAPTLAKRGSGSMQVSLDQFSACLAGAGMMTVHAPACCTPMPQEGATRNPRNCVLGCCTFPGSSHLISMMLA